MVSDLSEFHGLSLVDVLAGHTHSPRTLLSYIVWLPDNSALAASMRGEKSRGWGTERHLLATLVDAVQANTWVTAATASKRKPRKPTRVPRPKSDNKAKARVVRVADLVKGR